MKNNKYVVWFEEVHKGDVNVVGGKGANLGEMVNAGFRVPYGFILTSKAYFKFIEQAHLEVKIKTLLKSLNYNRPQELKDVSAQIRKLILETPFPKFLLKESLHYYENLLVKEKAFFDKKFNPIKAILVKAKQLYKEPLVAIRSSATAEDLPTASFAGQQETYLNVKGENSFLRKVRECWASLYTERAVYYRHEQGFDDKRIGLAVVVQRMIESDKSGISFSIDPVTNDKTKIVIEAIFGLGEYIVQGIVTPDHYEVNKRSLVILKKQKKRQLVKFVKKGRYNKEVRLSLKKGSEQKLSDNEIIKVALAVRDIEKHYYFPQDIEWAIEKGVLYIVQSRPITTTGNKKGETEFIKSKLSEPILTGAPASPGIGVGPVKIIESASQIGTVKRGDILVAPQTNPDYVPAMKKAVAIVTERGGRTSHAAIVSRELGIPAVVGAEKARKHLRNGMIISVNGATGEVFKGRVLISKKKKEEKNIKRLKTITKLYVNMAQPDQAKITAKKDCDGIGLLRAEFIIANIGIHPKEFIRKKKESVFISYLTRELVKFVKPFSPRPVVYRATDFKTNEYSHLIGGKKYEPKEENPMLGYRGASRYIVDQPVFEMELQAIRKIWEKGYHNLHLMIPFVRLPWELIKIKEIIRRHGLLDLPGFKLWIMVEVPSCALGIEEFLKVGVDGLSIGSNDLTMMLLGVDRDNEEVAPIFDERQPIVLQVIEYVVKTALKYGVTCSICGQAASDYPEFAERLVKAGITSMSVSPDALGRTREQIFALEKKFYKKRKSR